jgi:X-Pro dipeptidyl-peptidase
MKAGTLGRLAAAVAATLTTLALAPTALAQAPSVVVEDGVTQPVFDYGSAIRERVWIQSDFDSDLDGVADEIAVDIMRPAESDAGLDVPAIIDASPYYTTLGRGNESEEKEDTNGDGVLDRWPLFYDNYFVPRGYAVILLDMVGTASSTGCPRHGGLEDVGSGRVVIDWLNGRRAGRDAVGNPVAADWHNGKAGMIGKSYDGTLANGTASTGVAGLTTIVPISAISSWYEYSRSNGIRFNTNYPTFLAGAITDEDNLAHCAPVREFFNANDGDETGDYTPFWVERDYVKDVGNVSTSVFAVHGLQDDNVKTDDFAKWWDELSAREVPRKIWLTGTGHVEGFDFRRAEWVATIHRWFDYWLQGYPNGIMDEPMADVEVGPDVWETYDNWPVPGTEDVNVWLRPGEAAGTLALTPESGKPQTRSFTDNPNQGETAAISNPEAPSASRLAFLSQPLTQDLRLSGAPRITVRATSSLDTAYLGAILVDYGTKTRISRTNNGIVTGTVEDCWGASSASDDACYLQVSKRLQTSSQWRVARGILDGQNRSSFATAEPLVPGEEYDFTFRLYPNDYTFSAGSRIGVILVGSYPSFSVPLSTRPTLTVDLKQTRIVLPVEGGHLAAMDSGGF